MGVAFKINSKAWQDARHRLRIAVNQSRAEMVVALPHFRRVALSEEAGDVVGAVVLP